MSTTGTTDDGHRSFWETYYGEQVAELAQQYPGDKRHLTIEWGDLLRYDVDLAEDYLKAPDTIDQMLRNALEDMPIPAGSKLDGAAIQSDIDIRVVGLNDEDIYTPMEVIRDADSIDQEYIGVKGELAKVTQPQKEAQQVAFECVRCGTNTIVPQTGDDFQEPHECSGCERQGPFQVLPDHEQTVFNHHVRVRTETPPDRRGELQNDSIDGDVRGDLVWSGGEDFGLAARSGDSVIVYGTVEKQQITEGRSKTCHFEEYLDIQAIEFDEDSDDVDIEEHRPRFEQLAERDDAVDVFADSIAPGLYATPEWECALEALVAYLFGSPRIDVPEGPTIRGDIHVLIVSDYGMGKSMVNEAVADFSPDCIKESVTGMSSDVGLLAAAVEDDFGDGQWTLEPGILVRANGGHVILDEIDKTDADLERMNDALEGEQRIDVNKAGQSATFNSRVGLLATGNPVESRFDKSTPISQQLGIDQSLLSRFDAIVTMEDSANREKDSRIAETQAMSYVEAQEYEFGDRDEFEHLDRVVDPDVGRAWIAEARQAVHPKLTREHVETIRDWYADEIRTLNEQFNGDGGGDMPVPASARSVMDTIRFAVAFARVHLRDEVTDADVERAMDLTETLVGQTFDGSTGQFQSERTKGGSQDERISQVKAIVRDLEGEHPADIDDVLTEAQERINLSVSKTEDYVDQLKTKGKLYEPGEGELRTT
jgi:replicative DNA helicase Mcm